MKKHNLLIATLLLVVAAVSVAVVSCKKEDTKALSNNNSKETFDPRQIDDMNAYLKDFKNRMLSAAKGEDEVLSLDEAAWHLSSVANYDFCNANVEYDDVRFDTLYSTVIVTNGSVILNDLAVAYEHISLSIEEFYNSIMLDDKHFHFINITISEDGNAVVFLKTTYKHSGKNLDDNLWYFSDDYECLENCSHWFPSGSYYLWNDSAVIKLTQRLNLIESHNLLPSGSIITPPTYYTPTRIHDFYYSSYTDEYGSPSAFNSRLYVGGTYYSIPYDEMCYYIDSYAGLGYQFIIDNHYTNDEHPVAWLISCDSDVFPGFHWPLGYHTLSVAYGKLHSHVDEPDPEN